MLLFRRPTGVGLIVMPRSLDSFASAMVNVFRRTLYISRPRKRGMLHQARLRILFRVAGRPIHASVRQFNVLHRTSLHVMIFIGVEGHRLSFFKSHRNVIFTILLLTTSGRRGIIRQQDSMVFVPMFTLLGFPGSFSRRRLVFQRNSAMGSILVRESTVMLRGILGIVTDGVCPRRLQIVFGVMGMLLGLFKLMGGRITKIGSFLSSVGPRVHLTQYRVWSLVISTTLLPMYQRRKALFRTMNTTTSCRRQFYMVLRVGAEIIWMTEIRVRLGAAFFLGSFTKVKVHSI